MITLEALPTTVLYDPPHVDTIRFERHVTWAEQIARGMARYAHLPNEEDDAAQVALVTLWKISGKYRPGNVTFKTWAKPQITRDVGRILHTARRRADNIVCDGLELGETVTREE